MTEPFIVRALLAGVGVALAAGALGCFVVWRRMAYFGDSLAHASLAGIALGLLAEMGANYGAFAVAFVFAFLLSRIHGRGPFAADTVLGIIAHVSLALGVVAVSLIDVPVFNLHSFLFGDILTVGAQDIFLIYACSAAVFALLLFNRDSLLLMTISEDLAKAEGVNTTRLNFLLMFLMAVVVAVSFQVVGVLLITSMLIVPAAAGQIFARSPEMMVFLSCLVGVVSVFLGIYCSLVYDTPSGPSIVAVSALFFILFLAVSILLERVLKGKFFRNSDGTLRLKTFFVLSILSFAVVSESYGAVHIDGEIDAKLHMDKVVSAEEEEDEGYEGYSHSHITAEIFAGKLFSIYGELLFEGEPSGDEHAHEDEDGDEEGEDAFFVGHALSLHRWALKIPLLSGEKNVLFYGGKIVPVVGLSLHDFPGVYSYRAPHEYELIDKIGLGGRFGFDGGQYGKHSFDFSAFAADTTIFSSNEGGRLRKSDGGVSNTGDLSSFALSIGGGDFFLLGGGLPALLLDGLSYRFSYAKQAKGADNERDENRFSVSARRLWRLTENFSSVIVGEYVNIKNLDGEASHDRTHTTTVIGFDWKEWAVAFGLSLEKNSAEEAEESADISIFNCSLSRKIGKAKIGLGYQRQKEQGEKAANRIGILLSYHGFFSSLGGGGHEGHSH